MRKTRFLALTLAVVLVLMGAGYAYWTEAIQIKGTVTTGELDFAFSEATVISSPEHAKPVYVQVRDKGEGKDNMLRLKFEDIYPGAEAKISFKVENRGTMPLKVTGFEFKPIEGSINVLKQNLKITLNNNNPIDMANYNEIPENLTYLIEKGQSFPISLKFEIDENADETRLPESKRFEFSIEAVAKQLNDI